MIESIALITMIGVLLIFGSNLPFGGRRGRH